MSKKHDLPAMPWYWGDWFKCPEVRACSPEARCLWFEMIGLMWESTERGYLTLNGKPMDEETLARCLGFASLLLHHLLQQLEAFGVFSRREDGAIFCRRIVHDAEIAQKRALSGKLGGFAKAKGWQKVWQKAGKTLANTEDEDERGICIGVDGTGKKGNGIVQTKVSEWGLVREWSEFIKAREVLGKGVDEYQQELLIGQLMKENQDTRKKMLDQSILNGWFYLALPVDERNNKSARTGESEPIPIYHRPIPLPKKPDPEEEQDVVGI